MRTIDIPIALDGTGAVSGATHAEPVHGTVAEIRVTGAGLTNAGKPDVTITRDDGAQILKVSNTDAPYSKVPQQPVVTNENAAALYAAGGAAVLEEIPVAGYVSVAVAEGNANGKGNVRIYLEDC